MCVRQNFQSNSLSFRQVDDLVDACDTTLSQCLIILLSLRCIAFPEFRILFKNM